MLKHFVEFATPGTFFTETEVRQVKTRIPAELHSIPKYTFALEFFDQEEISKEGEALTGKAKNHSIRIVFGKVFTKDELPAEGFNEHSPLFHNADNTDGKVIKSITGNWQPWDEKWIILEGYPNLKTLTEPI